MKLHEIQQKLKAPKSQYNSFSKFYYRNAEDILEAVKPLLEDSVLILSDEIVNIGERYYVKTTATFMDGKNTTSVTAYAREAADRKGMDDSQITGATSSYARKYALNGLFLIDDTKDADHDGNAAETPKRPTVPARKPFTPPAARTDEKNPDIELKAKKDRVVSLLKLHGFEPKGKTTAAKKKEYEDAVFDRTGLALNDENLEAIAETLSAKLEANEAQQ